MWRLWNQRTFELQKSIIYHWKGLEKCYSLKTFSKTLTETLPSKNPKTLKLYPQNRYLNETFLIKITYYISFERSQNVEFNVYIFKNINRNLTIENPKNPDKTLNFSMPNQKPFDNYGILCIVEKLLKLLFGKTNCSNWYSLEGSQFYLFYS